MPPRQPSQKPPRVMPEPLKWQSLFTRPDNLQKASRRIEWALRELANGSQWRAVQMLLTGKRLIPRYPSSEKIDERWNPDLPKGGWRPPGDMEWALYRVKRSLELLWDKGDLSNAILVLRGKKPKIGHSQPEQGKRTRRKRGKSP